MSDCLDGRTFESEGKRYKILLVENVKKIRIPNFEMVDIEPGNFLMGSEHEDPDEKPIHHVQIGKPFRIGKYPVTQRQWLAVMGNNPSYFQKSGLDSPVTNVSWNDVQEFIRKVNENSKEQYRLPTEAEWEYACRGGVNKDRWFQDEELGVYA